MIRAGTQASPVDIKAQIAAIDPFAEDYDEQVALIRAGTQASPEDIQAQIDEEEPEIYRAKVKNAIYDGIDKTIHQFGAHWGYQPLPAVLDNLFKNISDKDDDIADIKDSLKSELYTAIMVPAIDKMKRILAIQVAIPGNPSVYLPDFYGMTGGELKKNMYLQDRHPLPYDEIDEDIAHLVGDLQETGSQFLSLRKSPALQALNDGQVLTLEPNGVKHVLPIARDNGQDQVLMFINTGAPKQLNENYLNRFQKVQIEGRGPYLHPHSLREIIRNYYPTLNGIKPTPGTLYYRVDIASGEPDSSDVYFIDDVNKEGRILKSTKHPDKGIDFDIAAVFVRAPLDEQPEPRL